MKFFKKKYTLPYNIHLYIYRISSPVHSSIPAPNLPSPHHYTEYMQHG